MGWLIILPVAVAMYGHNGSWHAVTSGISRDDSSGIIDGYRAGVLSFSCRIYGAFMGILIWCSHAIRALLTVVAPGPAAHAEPCA